MKRSGGSALSRSGSIGGGNCHHLSSRCASTLNHCVSRDLSIYRPFTILLRLLYHPSVRSCHNAWDSGVQLIHDAYRNGTPYGTLLPMRTGLRVPVMKRVLIIEDDKDIVELVRYNLTNEGFQVSAAFDGAGGLSTLRKTPPD